MEIKLTFDDIKQRIAESDSEAHAVLCANNGENLRLLTLDQADAYKRVGRLTDAEYRAFCYLWRNLAYRSSNNCVRYDLRKFN